MITSIWSWRSGNIIYADRSQGTGYLQSRNTRGFWDYCYFFSFLIVYLFFALLGLRCCEGFSLAVVSGLSLQWLLFLLSRGSRARVLQSLRPVGSLVAAPEIESTGSIFVAHGLRYSAARGILPDQGLNPFLLHWQADSLPLNHQW